MPKFIFRNCSGFTGALTIPNTVTTIDEGAFSGCSGFNGNLTISNTLTSIGKNAFLNCSKLTGDLNIPNTVTTLGISAFYGCEGFEGSLKIGSGLIDIPDYAFRECHGFTGDLIIPNNIKTIGESAFDGCSSFDGNLTLSNTLETLGARAFRNCSLLTGDLEIPASLKVIPDQAFETCSSLDGNLILHNNITDIGKLAFRYCSSLSGSLSIPTSSNYTEIKEGVFYGCASFSGDLTIPDNITKIGQDAFKLCTGLNGTLTIPDSVKDIGSFAFEDTAFSDSRYPAMTSLSFDLVSLPEMPTPLMTGFTGVVNSGNSKEILSKASKWTNKEQTEAEIRIEYALKYESNRDIIFVLDYSSSMLESEDVTVVENGTNVTRKLPRSVIMDSFVRDTISALLANASHNNRVALTAFGGADTALWTQSFTTDVSVAKNALYENPLLLNNGTSYTAGLNSARELIDNRADKSREVLILFISDGIPNPGKEGIAVANYLRGENANVTPIAIFTTDATGALDAISQAGVAGSTRVANTAEQFAKAITDIVDKPIDMGTEIVCDILSNDFEFLTGDLADITVSTNSGTATIDVGLGKIDWNLSGCEKNALHSINIKVKLSEEARVKYGRITTNNSLTSTNLIATTQPTLLRHNKNQPGTGDNSNVIIPIIMMAGSLLVLGIFVVLQKKKK